MKNKKWRYTLVVLAGFFTANTVNATTTYITHDSHGNPLAVFTQVKGPEGFGMSWQDPNWVTWSSYQGDFSNHRIENSTGVTFSPATTACAKIGGELPEMGDFNRLVSYFEGLNGYLTKQGRKDFQAIFPAMTEHESFWSSTSSWEFGHEMGILDNDGSLWYDPDDSTRHSVMCVSKHD